MSAASHLGDRAAALVDGELGHDARDRTLAHLTVCDSCRAEIDALRQLKATVSALPGPGPSVELIQRLLAVGAAAGPGSPRGPDDLAGEPALPRAALNPVATPDPAGALTYGAGPTHAALLGHTVLRTNATHERRRSGSVQRVRAVIRAGVRIASGRPDGRTVVSRRPTVIRPRQRARLAAVGCFSIMIVVMATAFTTVSPSAGRPVPAPLVDNAGASAEYSSTFADLSPGGARGTRDVARPAREAHGGYQAATHGNIAPMTDPSSTVDFATTYVDDVGPDARASAFGTAYLAAPGE